MTIDITIYTVQEKLSDNSIAWNVQMDDLTFPAITEDDANNLAEKIVDAINQHSNTIATINYG